MFLALAKIFSSPRCLFTLCNISLMGPHPQVELLGLHMGAVLPPLHDAINECPYTLSF